MNEHERLQAIKYIRYALGIIKENAVASGDYRSKNQEAILSAMSAMKPHVDALMQDASQVTRADCEEEEDVAPFVDQQTLSLLTAFYESPDFLKAVIRVSRGDELSVVLDRDT